MLFGIFNGFTPTGIEKRIVDHFKQVEKLAGRAQEIRVDISTAIADRTAAISEIRTDILQLTDHLSKLH